ncbi:MAG: polyprenyl synthetase family protein [Thermoanaerobaculum sp.]|nr:polyprenyl synthetase family protein [Thermoanaerobaculum sp.]
MPVEDPLRAAVDTALGELLASLPSGVLGAAMRAAVFPGGKRLRPLLLLRAGQAFGADPQRLRPLSAALELVHCASLALDDLPCMDDAPLRRGEPSLHRRFSEATAILAAFALLAKAVGEFPALLRQAGLPPAYCEGWTMRLSQLVETLCEGQQLDLARHGTATVAELERVHAGKTGAFFAFAAELGAFVAGADPASVECVRSFARNLGLAYQVLDDVADATGGPGWEGKPPGQDARHGQCTFVTLLGVEGARQLANELLSTAEACLAPLSRRAEPLLGFVNHVRALL